MLLLKNPPILYTLLMDTHTVIKVLAHSDDIDVKQTRSAVHPFSLIKENENKVFFSETNKKKLWNFF